MQCNTSNALITYIGIVRK